jgi:mannose-6-phosphate isomerase-like protein (cupin superfamily)
VTSSALKSFKRAPSLELSKWYLGSLTTNLAERNDTDGAFCLVQATLAPGHEPPPHMHSREDELFYVLDGEFDVYVGKEAFKVESGECIFLPRRKPHAFVIRSPRLRVLALFSPRRVGRRVPQHELACPKYGPSCWGAHLFDGGSERYGATLERVRRTPPAPG